MLAQELAVGTQFKRIHREHKQIHPVSDVYEILPPLGLAKVNYIRCKNLRTNVVIHLSIDASVIKISQMSSHEEKPVKDSELGSLSYGTDFEFTDYPLMRWNPCRCLKHIWYYGTAVTQVQVNDGRIFLFRKAMTVRRKEKA